MGIPQSLDVKAALKWARGHDKHVISLCHGPAALLAAAMGEENGDHMFKGYRICAFPDSIDAKTPEIGYMPGPMPWFIGERLREAGFEIVNSDITGQIHQDRKLITGDSPFASNHLGKVAAQALLNEVGSSSAPASSQSVTPRRVLRQEALYCGRARASAQGNRNRPRPFGDRGDGAPHGQTVRLRQLRPVFRIDCAG